MTEAHGDLIGLSDRDLLLRASDATHQHYKGGLYRFVGTAHDSEDGLAVRGRDGKPRVLYEHVYPYRRQFWLRDHDEFNGSVEVGGATAPRFRRLG